MDYNKRMKGPLMAKKVFLASNYISQVTTTRAKLPTTNSNARDRSLGIEVTSEELPDLYRNPGLSTVIT